MDRISRREALSGLAKVAGAAALSFVAGGLMGYLFAPRRERVITRTSYGTLTLTKILTRTITSTKTVTFTETQTVTQTTTISDLERRLNEVIREESKAKDKAGDLEYAIELASRLGFDGGWATDATVKAIGEYAVAVREEQLPEEFEALELLTQGTQDKTYGAKLVDFSPIVFHSVDGNDVVLSMDAPRDTWMLARHVKALVDNGYDVLNHPEAFEGLNAQVIADAWSIFDAEYGIGYLEKKYNRVVKPSDADVEELMLLQWELFDKARHGKYYNWDFPWWDSDKLEKLYPDKNTRRQALLFFWYLPNITFDMKAHEFYKNVLEELYSEKKITRGMKSDLYRLELDGYCIGYSIGHEYKVRSKEDIIKFVKILEDEGKIEKSVAERLIELVEQTPFRFKRFGMDGAKFALEQAFEEYKKISELYPDGKIGKWNEDPRNFYYGWLVDRGSNGLPNTIKQFVGVDWETLHFIKTHYFNKIFEHIKGYNGLDQYLTKNWKYWDLIKFIAGYERGNPNVTEVDECNYVIPDILRLVGYPTSHINIEPTPKGAANREWTVSLPDYVINGMQNILVGPGNTFGLYACKEGLEKDKTKVAYVLLPSTSKVIYLMKKS